MPPRKTSKNVEMLGVVAKGLKGLKQKVVFVGGATVDLFIDDPAAPATRATDDVDCVVEVASKSRYHALEEELRGLGFTHPMGENAPIYRWNFRGIKVDVMPTEGVVLGFNNRWYPEGMANAEEVVLPNEERIFAFAVPCLLASKLEAFHDRGKGDFPASKDMEDVIALLDGRAELEGEVGSAPSNLREYLAREFAGMLADERFLLGLDGQLKLSAPDQERVNRCLEIMGRIARQKT